MTGLEEWIQMNKKGQVPKLAAVVAGCAVLLVILVMAIPKKTESDSTQQAAVSAVTETDEAVVETVVRSPMETLDWDAVIAAQETTNPVLEQYKAQREEIPDLIGWLRIEGTGIDYPVVQRDDDYYVTHNVYGEDDVYGAIFLEQVNDAEKPDNNLMIYGHHRKDAKMFGELMEYKSEAYYKEHPVIEFDTLYAQGRYEIISVFLSKVYFTSDTDFKYYQFFGSDDPDEFQNYVDNVKRLSLYEIEADASFGDELITLSTCEYSVENGRMAIVARKLPDEVPQTDH